jgi:hypothetical protein
LISKARKQVGRKKLSTEAWELIFRIMGENPTWGAPRNHGELLMLGFDASERTIARWIKRVPRDPQPAQCWRAFLANHREAIAAMDFFTVPTITFGVFCRFFVIRHDRRRILHFNLTPLGRDLSARSRIEGLAAGNRSACVLRRLSSVTFQCPWTFSSFTRVNFSTQFTFPSLTAILRKCLFKTTGIRANVRPDMPNKKWLCH